MRDVTAQFPSADEPAVSCPLCSSDGAVVLVGHREFARASISQCSACGFVFASNVDPAGVARFYASEYRVARNETPLQTNYIRDARIRADAQYSYITRHVDMARVTRVGEIGCASGVLLSAFAEAGHVVAGCDPDVAMSSAARSSGLDVTTGTLDDFLALDQEPFDLLILSHVLEHLIDPIASLRRLSGLLRPGAGAGVLFIEVPNDNPEKVAWMASGGSTSAHVSFFNPQSLRRAIEEAGFRVEAMHSAGPPLSSLRPPFMTRAVRRLRRLVGEIPPDTYSHPTLAGVESDDPTRVALRAVAREL